MSKKALWFDVETTGLSSFKHDIIQIACIVEIDGIVKDEFETKVQPFDLTAIDPKALEVNKLTIDKIRRFPAPRDVFRILIGFLDAYVDKYNKEDKYYTCGYNVNFDVGFLQSFFKKNGNSFYGSYFSHKNIDPMPILHNLEYNGKIKLPNYKLLTACKHFGIDIDAHDALSDIRATMQLYKILHQ